MIAVANRLGTVYHCPICGAEVTVIRSRDGALAPICCDRLMERRPSRSRIYFCAICGAELAVVRASDGDLAPVCCNELMQVKDG